jgi:hypothetical protein
VPNSPAGLFEFDLLADTGEVFLVPRSSGMPVRHGLPGGIIRIHLRPAACRQHLKTRQISPAFAADDAAVSSERMNSFTSSISFSFEYV